MKLGYDTNGFAHHRLEDALAVLSELGYETVAITLDHSALNPFDRQVGREAEKVQRLLVKHHLGCVLETSARFLLDPWRKFQPTLISPRPRERERRIEFLRRAIKLAATLHADIVSFQSGDSLDDAPHSLLQERLVESLRPVLAAAEQWRVSIAMEPAAGMLIDSIAAYQHLLDRLRHSRLFVTVDLAHVLLTHPVDWEEQLRHCGPHIGNVRIADVSLSQQRRLPLGKGDLDCRAMVNVLNKLGYAKGLYVALPEYADDAVTMARACLGHLRQCLRGGANEPS